MNPDPAQPVELSDDGPLPSAPDEAGSSDTGAAPIDSLTQEVLTGLEQAPEQRTWVQALFLLALSLIAFNATGLLSYSQPDLLILVGVLIFHELGHYVGMWLFNYQDVRMFFIPFFGAAVSGRKTSVAGYKEAIVILLGPVPGILLGSALGVACWFYDSALLRSLAGMLLLINGFNLLPFLPLDGGRLLHLVLFSRQRHLEALFRLLTGVSLALCGWAMGAWVLTGLGALMALSTGHTFRVSTLAQKLRGQFAPAGEINLSSRIPLDQALPLVLAVRKVFPQLKHVKPLVNTVRQVWEQLHIQPPGLWASAALLGVYAGALLGTPVVYVLFHQPYLAVVLRTQADGTTGNVEEVRVWGQLRRATELNSDQQYHGRHVVYASPTGKKIIEGAYQDGLPDGTWTFYGPQENPEGTAVFQHGELLERTGNFPAK